jgi:hypothetical protein
LCGDLIGEGHERKVYAHVQNPDLVLKVEKQPRYFANVAEWQLYEEVGRVIPDMIKWLARVVDISHSGAVLIQERTTPISIAERPKQVPEWLSDLKLSNFSRTKDGRVVCHDTGMHRAWMFGLSRKLVTAKFAKG